MLLKSLELQGFKTFPDKTVLTFDRGITAVVGPNGSGKSNISDAMRWVLGEQSAKVLRCSRMEDIIFNGTPERRAQGFAEVTLTIDNSQRRLPFDSSEVAVTRRYYRSGESEYLLNRAAVRLRDIHELFMDTGLGRDGYSMIGQGKIDSIVAARSEDRREIFEEAAGISRFRYRKEESERRLAQAEENLLRLRDILGELESRVGPLKEQAEKAERYLALAARRRTLEVSLWVVSLEQAGRALREQEDKLAVARAQHEEAGARLDALAAHMEENYAQANALAGKMDEARQQASSLEEAAVRKDGEALVLENDKQHNAREAERLRAEAEQASRSGEELEREIAARRAEIAKGYEAAQEKDAEFAGRAAELEALRKAMGESSQKAEEVARRMAEMTARASEEAMKAMSAATSVTEIDLRIAAAQSAAEDRKRRREEAESAAAELQEMLAGAARGKTALENAAKGHEMRLASKRAKAEEARKKSEALRLDAQEQERRAKLLEDLERNLEGFTQSVKAVMKESARGTLRGVRGPLSRLFRTPREYAVAVETALGPAMQHLVVETEQDAKRAIRFLQQRDAGRATFLPVDTIRGSELQERGLESCAGFIGIASRLCECPEEYRGVLRSALGRVVLAEDLDSAAAIARNYSYRFRVVTLDGQVVNAGGSLTGGSRAKNSGLLSRASEIERVRALAAEWQAKADGAAQAYRAAQEEVSAAEAALSAARGELASAQEERLKLEAEYSHTLQTVEELRRAEQELHAETESAAQRRRALAVQQAEAEQAAARWEADRAALQKEMDALSGSREEEDRRSRALAEALQELRLAALALRKDCEAGEAAVRELEDRRRGHSGQAERLRAAIEDTAREAAALAARGEGLQREAAALRAQAQGQKERAEQLAAQRMELEKAASGLRAQERELSAERERAGHELARLEERKGNLQKEYDSVISRLWEEYELTRSEAEQAAGPVENVPQAQKELNELKTQIKALGAVNVAAVDEYREVSGRYEFLSGQVADVEQSRSELQKLIGDLTRQMQEIFSARFAQINENFVHTFRELFGGGGAGLQLTDPGDVLGSGIEISVQPPGKIVTHLELLSGGEKALVAIALYFAIMKVNPPPFCVLDEIEAALDDVNVGRFAAYLRRMNEETQFIVITHRRGTMEEADVLYGVTMQDEGVSKLLELHTADWEKELGPHAGRGTEKRRGTDGTL